MTTTEPSTCPPEHPHGNTSTCYGQHKCRCANCREGHRARSMARRKAKAYGRYVSPFVDAAPVRAHLETLVGFGMGYRRIALMSGTSTTGVRTLLEGRPSSGPRKGQLPARTNRIKAEKILALRPDIALMAPGAFITARGTQRRLQALVAIGWPLSRLAARIGISSTNMSELMRSRKVTVRRHREVAALFDELWATPFPVTTRVSAISRRRALTMARTRRWLPPMAWDDLDTDLEPPAPDDGPYVGIDFAAVELAVTDGADIRLTVLERREAVRRLVDQHLSDPAIAAHLHIAERTVLRIRDELHLAAVDPNLRRNAA